MHIVFINPPFKPEYGKFSRESRSPAITASGALYYPLWLIYAAAYSKKYGHHVDFIDAPAKLLDFAKTVEIVKSKVSLDEAVLFVLDTSTPSIKNDVRFGAALKDIYCNSFVLLVGTHPTATAEETLSYDSRIDAVAIGEYDYIVKELADALEQKKDISSVRSLCYRNSENQLVFTEKMPPVEQMDEIPFASQFIKEYLDERDYFFTAATYPSIQIFTGRGCPCRCNFCVYPQTMHGHKYRARSPENVVAEFEYIANNFNDVKEVVIEDDTFTINKERIRAICNLLIQKQLNKRLKWLCNARVNSLDFETMRLMKQAGCRLLIPGIESGNQQILDNIKKGTKVEQYLPYIRNAKKAGLLVHACYMVGNQGETKESMQDTLKLALKLNTDTAQFFPLIPYPGTEAYEYNKTHGYLTAKDYDDYCLEDGSYNSVLELPELSSKDMVEFCNYALKKYYLRPRYIFHRIYVGIRDFDDFKRSIKAFGTFVKKIF